MQQIIITGNLGCDPEMRYTPEGKAVCAFSVAVKQGDKTIWFRVSAWEKQAENCNQYLKKGSKVLVIGRLQADANGQPRTYETKDGKHAASFEITAGSVEYLTPKGEGAAAQDEETPF